MAPISNWRGVLGQYSSTFGTWLGVFAGQFLLYKLAAVRLGKDGFAEYAVARTTVGVIQPVLLLGLAVGLPRYIAIAMGKGDAERPSRYFAATLWCVASTIAIGSLVLSIWKRWFAYLFFGSSQLASLIPAMLLMAAGLTLHSVAYSYFRGRLVMRRSNLLQFINLGIAPPLLLLFFGTQIRSFLFALGALWSVVSVTVMMTAPLHALFQNTFSEARELLHYSVQRVPGDLIYPALLTLPATLLAHSSGVREAGFQAFAISIMSTVGGMFSIINIILLPKAGRMLAEGDLLNLRSEVLHLLAGCTALIVIITMFIEIFAGTLIRLYLGTGFEEVASTVRIVIPGAIPIVVNAVFNGLLDAYHHKAVTTGATMVGMLVFLVLVAPSFMVHYGPIAISLSMLAGLTTIAALTGREGLRILSLAKVEI